MKNYRLLTLMLFSLLISCKEDVLVPNQEQIIRIEAESSLTNLSADGTTIITFKATIPAEATETAKNVTFTITPGLGTFQGTVIDSKNTVHADASGIARTSIKLGSTAGTFYISASVTRDDIMYRSQDLPVTLVATGPFALEAIADNPEPEANGFTLISLTATTTDPNEKTVKLNTNLGVFTQSANPLETELNFVQGKATTLFRISNQATAHIISLTTGLSKTALLQVKPLISRPEVLLVEPSALLTDSVGGAIQLRCFLRKTNTSQKVSVGYPVSFRAYQTINGAQVNVGRFTGTAAAISDPDGAVPVVNFFADSGNIDTSKGIILECSTFKNTTEQLHVLTTVKIKK